MADAIVALSEKDRESLQNIMQQKGLPASENKQIKVLLPCLRGDIQDIANQPAAELEKELPTLVAQRLKERNSSKQRCLVTCVVRLSPEKDTLRFVTFCKLFRGWMKDHGYISLLAGACSDQIYAQQVKESLLRVCEDDDVIIIDSFLTSKALAAIFSRSVINFHPCAYEAYGMTIVEAAVMGTPSVINRDGQVGATALLPDDASIQISLEPGNSDIAESAQRELETKLLRNSPSLTEIGEQARIRALGWDEAAYGKTLLGMLRAIVDRSDLPN